MECTSACSTHHPVLMPWTVIAVAFDVVVQSPAASADVAPDVAEPSHEPRVDDLGEGSRASYADV